MFVLYTFNIHQASLKIINNTFLKHLLNKIIKLNIIKNIKSHKPITQKYDKKGPNVNSL